MFNDLLFSNKNAKSKVNELLIKKQDTTQEWGYVICNKENVNLVAYKVPR